MKCLTQKEMESWPSRNYRNTWRGGCYAYGAEKPRRICYVSVCQRWTGHSPYLVKRHFRLLSSGPLSICLRPRVISFHFTAAANWINILCGAVGGYCHTSPFQIGVGTCDFRKNDTPSVNWPPTMKSTAFFPVFMKRNIPRFSCSES